MTRHTMLEEVNRELLRRGSQIECLSDGSIRAQIGLVEVTATPHADLSVRLTWTSPNNNGHGSYTLDTRAELNEAMAVIDYENEQP